ncbi:MAG: orotidine-5'-phosphate decarboxylase [Acidobacteriota bacterium]
MGASPTLIVALDVSGLDEALRLRDTLGEVVDFFKVGSELFTSVGPGIVKELCSSGSRVFLDLKFHDTPTTVGRAVAAACRLGATLVDIHVSGGAAMMVAALEAAKAAGEAIGVEGIRPLVFGITVLTALGEEDGFALGFQGGTRQQALRLARLALQSGLDGVVASGTEIRAIREATDDRLEVLVPGVRPDWASEVHDQKRVVTPAEAARAGARYVVVGRAITGRGDSREAASRILDELAG